MPVAILEAVRGSVLLPSAQDALDLAGVGVAWTGPVGFLDGTLSSVFEPRAVMEIRAFVTSEIIDLGTYVETVEITNEDTAEEFDVTIA
jgi:hypothetical protein